LRSKFRVGVEDARRGRPQRKHFGTTRQTTRAVRKTLPRNAARPNGMRT